MQINAVWYPIRQWEEAKHFYGTLLGLKLNHLSDELGYAAYGTKSGVPFFLVRKPELAGQRGGATVTFQPADLDGLLQRLETAGVRMTEESGHTRLITIYDPDGNALELSGSV